MLKSELNPLVSVILPVYNCEKYIAASVDSILHQTYTNFELIVINDGSSDSTLNILKSYDDVRIRIVNRQNMGLVYSLNEGISLANGKYIARMDADDYSDSRRFEYQISLMQSERLDVCGCNFSIINEEDTVIGFKEVPVDNFNLVLMTNVPFAHGSVMMRADFLKQTKLRYGLTQYVKAEDYQLWVNFFEAGAKFGNVPVNLFSYRDVTGSLSSDKKNMYHAAMISYEFMFRNELVLTKYILTLDKNIINRFKCEISNFLLLTFFEKIKIKVYLFKKINSLNSSVSSFFWLLKVHLIRYKSKHND